MYMKYGDLGHGLSRLCCAQSDQSKLFSVVLLGKLLAALVVVFSHHVAFTTAAASSVVANPQKLTVGMTHSVR